MKIATWNVERLKHYKNKELLLQETVVCDADILVFTETDSRLAPEYPYCFQTPFLLNDQPVKYAKTENRVSIYSRYECIWEYDTYDEYTAKCVGLASSKGELVIYGTIMGILGNRRPEFKEDVLKQMEDIRRLSSEGKNVCVIGDYNLSFSDDYYFTKFGRDVVNRTFSECGITILTAGRECCVDHIAISDMFVDGDEVLVSEWNYEKRLSDHKGIMVEIGV